MTRTDNKRRDQFEQQALPLLQSLFGQAYYLTRNRADAEDLLQETYVRGMQKFDRYEQGTNLKAWLGRILFNQFVNEYRRRKRRSSEVHVEDTENFVGQLQPEIDRDYLASKDATELIHDYRFVESLDGELKAGLEEMDGRFRDVLLLNTVGELSYKDIAKRLKLPIGTVMSRLHRARLFLRKRLGPSFTLAA